MAIISAKTLQPFSQYKDNKLKLKIIHFCPLDGVETDPKCKRIVVTTDVSQQSQTIDQYLVIVFFGCYAKTPFKKSTLKSGQLFTLFGFETGVMPKNKVFKCNGHLLKQFYEPLVLVKPEFESIIKMLVSLREESFVAIPDSDSVDHQLVANNDNENEDIVNKSLSKSESKRDLNSMKTLAKKRLNFDSSDENMSSAEDLNNDSRRRLRSNSKKKTNKRKVNENNKQMNSSSAETQSNTEMVNNLTESLVTNVDISIRTERRYEYKTLMEVHSLMPVSGKTYCHIYGIFRYKDKENVIHLRDEKIFTLSIHLKPGRSGSRSYPTLKPGDVMRIHRILMAPNSMAIICTDPKDVVVFKGFQNSDLFSPIKTSINPTFDDFDRQRKQELEEWFTEELLADSLSKKKSTSYSSYTDLAVQVIRVTNPSPGRSCLTVWDTTKPALNTYRSVVDTRDMDLNSGEEEMARIINENEMAIVVTVFEQHSSDAQNIKPFDFIVLFNVNIRVDRFHENCFTYTLNSSYNFGKCIRFVDRESFLGKRFRDRIDEYTVMSAVNVRHDTIEDSFPSQSLPLDMEDNDILPETTTTQTAPEESTVFSEMDENFYIDCNQEIDFIEETESYLPIVHIVDIPNKQVLFDEIIANGVDKQLYKVKSRVISYLPSNDIKDVISVFCTNERCLRIISLRDYYIEDPLIDAILESTKGKIVMNCFHCNESTCVLTFKFIFIMQDMKHNKLMAQLFGSNADLFLNLKPEEVLQSPTKWSYIERLLNHFCPKMSSIESTNCENVLNYWVFQPLKLKDNVFIYNIRTAVAIEMADKCVGINLN